MAKDYKKITRCRCCKAKQVKEYINLGKQPLANSYHSGEVLPRYPLAVMLCTNCFHSQLSVVVNPDAMFKNYLYVSGTTKTFRNHCKALASDAVNRFRKKNLSVCDIACNDGTQLEYFRNLGCTIMGVDPAENLRPITKEKKIPVVVEYWVPKVAEKYIKQFDIITGTNVFAHVNDLDEFLKACRIALKDEGIFILEFPYCRNLILHNEFDTIYHEHLSYFLVHSFKSLVDRLGFVIVDVLQTPIHGGSIRFFLKKNDKQRDHAEIVYKLIAREKKERLLNKKTYKKFAYHVKKNKEDMKTLLKKLSSKKRKVIAYGASAKGNTMLNYFKIKPQYIIDDNPLKQNLFSPGMNVPIKPANVLKIEKGNLEIVISAWNFYNEILKRITDIRGEKEDGSIVYVPKVKRILIKKKRKIQLSA